MTSRTSVLLGCCALMAALCPAQVLLHEDFNDNSAGWILGPQWAIGPATASSTCFDGVFQDPSFDADGKSGGGVAGVVIGGCTGTDLHDFYWMVGPLLDTTGSTHLKLEFDRWLNADYDPFMHSKVEVWNGSIWVTVFETTTTATSDGAWTHVSYDITAHSNPALRVRFGYDITSGGAWNASGWNLDNVRISNGEFFYDRFVTSAAGWMWDNEWGVGDAASGGAGGGCSDPGDPAFDADGTLGGGLAGVVIGGDASTAVDHGYYWLTSPPIDTTGSTLLALGFDRWLNSDYPPYMQNRVEVWDGLAWVTVFESPGGCFNDFAWQPVLYDITPYSNAALRMRFGFEMPQAAGAYPMSQWNLDNVSVHDPSGVCALQMTAYNGPGSFRLSAHCLSPTIPPGTTLFNCITLVPGMFPNGWFFGIDPSLTGDVIAQWNTGALPFVGSSDPQGDVVWSLPGGVPPGIVVYGVTVAVSPLGYVLGNSLPITFVTL